jgi:hypothetical protein
MVKLQLPRQDPVSRIRYAKTLGIVAWGVVILCVAVAWVGVLLPDSAAQNRAPMPHGSIKISCKQCHSGTGYKPIRAFPDFDHKTTKFAINGMHKGLDCRQCHVKLIFSDVGTQCASCHADIHRRQLGSNCEQCHSVRGWREVVKGVNGHENRFPLLGAHQTLLCEDCHKSAAVGLFRGLNTDCAFCHINNYNNAKSVNHKAMGYSTKCETCHGGDSWQRNFDHARSTGFPLSGAHAPLDCVQCHIGGNFLEARVACSSCHLARYNSATNPNHIAAGFPQDCSICHGT